MKKTWVISLLAIALLLAACGEKTDQPVTPATPTTPSTDDRVESAGTTEDMETESGDGAVTTTMDEAIIVDDTKKFFGGDVEKDPLADVTNIKCNYAEKTLTFTLNNHGQKVWQIYGTMPFPAPTNMVKAKVFINNYESNRMQPYYDAGKRLFGPDEKFSKNCGSIETLAPGESTTCTLNNVPLKNTESLGEKNRIWVDAGYGDAKYVNFICD